ncbi:hypothetical protein [Clostridium haemolyticum]|uniref:hypothetical protein n=1 Tax=Clostridium haemolyticum TaxID=84025 RepID=UPI00069F0386|nr:hypothetical protein [Clostridium haemolyticum]CAG7840764.1 hypothetical protein CLOHAE12215_02188 [Clostridium haemolyticum]
MVHFKLLTEYEKQKIKYDKLYKMGISQKQIAKNISKELKVILLLPCILGIAVGTCFICLKFSATNIDTIYGLKFALISGQIYLLLQMMFYFTYKKLYINKILKIYQ